MSESRIALLLQRGQLTPRHLAWPLGPGGVPANPAGTDHHSSSVLLSAEEPDLDPPKPEGLGGRLHDPAVTLLQSRHGTSKQEVSTSDSTIHAVRRQRELRCENAASPFDFPTTCD